MSGRMALNPKGNNVRKDKLCVDENLETKEEKTKFKTFLIARRGDNYFLTGIVKERGIFLVLTVKKTENSKKKTYLDIDVIQFLEFAEEIRKKLKKAGL